MDHGWVHIICGDSAARSLYAAGVCDSEAILVQHDVLSCGPLKPFVSIEEWQQLRQDFWMPMCDRLAPCPQPHDLLENAHKLRDAKGIVLWVGSGLSDQLMLPSTLRIAELADAANLPLSTIQYTDHPRAKAEVIAMGELAPYDLVRHPEPRLLTGEDRAELRSIWQALTAADPETWLNYSKRHSVAFPVLRRALRSFLAKFPDLNSGLSRWDSGLLRVGLEHGSDSSRIVGHTLISGAEWLDPVGDTFLYWRLRKLGNSQLPHPPLRLRGEKSSDHRFKVEVTPTGEEILAGRKNFVHLNGIDEWIGGIHLQSSTNQIWFRDGDKLVTQIRRYN